MADPFPIYQQVVRDNPAFFKEKHGYVPDPNTKTGLAGVRSEAVRSRRSLFSVERADCINHI